MEFLQIQISQGVPGGSALHEVENQPSYAGTTRIRYEGFPCGISGRLLPEGLPWLNLEKYSL
jgi:hypothetical protein